MVTFEVFPPTFLVLVRPFIIILFQFGIKIYEGYNWGPPIIILLPKGSAFPVGGRHTHLHLPSVDARHVVMMR